MSEDYIDVQEILEGAHPDESAAYLFERIKVAVPAIADLRAQRDEARSLCGLGCDAAGGGPHSIMKDGKYSFCHLCGETMKDIPMRERARIAEAKLDDLRAQRDEIGAKLKAEYNATLRTAWPGEISEMIIKLAEVTAQRDAARAALRETLEIARRNETGDYVARAIRALPPTPATAGEAR